MDTRWGKYKKILSLMTDADTTFRRRSTLLSPYLGVPNSINVTRILWPASGQVVNYKPRTMLMSCLHVHSPDDPSQKSRWVTFCPYTGQTWRSSQGSSAVNLCQFVGVDLILWPTVYSCYRADTDVKCIKQGKIVAIVVYTISRIIGTNEPCNETTACLFE